MAMKHLEEKLKKSVEKDNKTVPPDWVTDQNASRKAWVYVEKLKVEKSEFIKRHFKATDFSTKKHYQIKGADIAKALDISRTSLMNTSGYSDNFREYLDGINEALAKSKDEKLKKAKKTPSRGSIRNSKAELVKSNTNLRKLLKELEAQKTEELVSRTFDELPLPVKKKLGIA